MKNLTQLIQESRNTLIAEAVENELRAEIINDHLWYISPDNLQFTMQYLHDTVITAIIRSEIDRKKGMRLKDMIQSRDYGLESEEEMFAYNTALNEDIQYWQAVLDELDKIV